MVGYYSWALLHSDEAEKGRTIGIGDEDGQIVVVVIPVMANLTYHY